MPTRYTGSTYNLLPVVLVSSSCRPRAGCSTRRRCVLFLVSFMNFDKALLAPPGTALVLGAAAATSQLTLNVSIDRFRATTQDTLAHGEKNSALSALAGMLVGAAVAHWERLRAAAGE